MIDVRCDQSAHAACCAFQCVHTDSVRMETSTSNRVTHMAKDAAISVRLTNEVKQAAEKAAQDDSRSVASLVEKLLRE
jgi:hypothetical protein